MENGRNVLGETDDKWMMAESKKKFVERVSRAWPAGLLDSPLQSPKAKPSRLAGETNPGVDYITRPGGVLLVTIWGGHLVRKMGQAYNVHIEMSTVCFASFDDILGVVGVYS